VTSRSSDILLAQASFTKIKTNFTGANLLKRALASFGHVLGEFAPESKFSFGDCLGEFE